MAQATISIDPRPSYAPSAWVKVLADRDRAEAQGRLSWINCADRQGAVGMAFNTGTGFDPDDGVHQIIDNVRWAEWIRDARVTGDYAKADQVRATAERLGQSVRILKGGHVAVVQGLTWAGSVRVNDAIGAMIALHEAG